jgi:hypothetical protein
MQRLRLLLLLVIGALQAGQTYAAAPVPAAGARLNNLKVLSDKIDDVTTVETILRSFVKPGMSDAERAKALWTAAIRYRHQAPPPNEFLTADWEAHDPVKLFNVYGYCMCCCSSALLEALNRLDGRPARGRILNGHSVPEVFYDGGWHMYDASLITYFPKPGSGVVAAVDDISEAVRSWYAQNPGCRGNPGKLMQIMRSDGWTGWKDKGPTLLANCPYYHLGYFPARTHGWDATMVEYDRKSEVYEYGYHVGHRALFSLRPGETLVREAGNRGLHVNGRQNPHWEGLKAKAPQNELAYVKDFLPGYNGGVVGNGYHRYIPDLAGGGLAGGAEVYDNLTAGDAPALHPQTGGKPGIAVVQLASPYVYLGGRLTFQAVRQSAADAVTVSLSTNGRTFAPVWQADKVGVSAATVDLGEKIARRYVYWLKVELSSAAPTGAGFNSFAVENDIQHAPRTLPWLGKGANTITIAADGDTSLQTRTVTCRITPDAGFTRNETSSSRGVVFDKLDVRDGSCWWKGGTGTMTVPVETPGEITAMRFCTQVRARGAKDLIRLVLSFDDGKTWQEAARIKGPTPGHTETHRFDAIPSGTKRALCRYELTGNNTVGIFTFRIDADYKDPRAAPTFRPFQVIHRWTENGQEKAHRETIAKLPCAYPIKTEEVPEMVTVTYEMPPK